MYEEPRHRSPLREPNHFPTHHDHREPTHYNHTASHTDHIRSKHTDHLVAGLPHSKYVDTGRETTLGSYCGIQPTKDYTSYMASQHSGSIGVNQSQVDTTDPQAVRDTHIHFLNDNINNPYKSDQPWSVPARLTHVGVHVPGSHPSGTGLSHYGVTSHRSVANGHLGTSDAVTTSGASMATNTTYTVPSPDSGLGKKLRKNLKSADRNTGTIDVPLSQIDSLTNIMRVKEKANFSFLSFSCT